MLKINLPLTIAGLATMSLVVACGQGGSKQNASIKQLRQEEVIAQGLKDSFPNYSPEDPQNILLAARFLGATLEVKEKQEKTAKTEPMAHVRLGFLLDNPMEELAAEGLVSERASLPLEPVKVDEKEIPAGYTITARCMPTSGCNQVFALLVHEEEISGGSMSSEVQMVPVSGGSGSDAEAIAGGSGSSALPLAGGSGSDDEVTVPTLKPKMQSMVAVLFSGANGNPMKIVWSASPTIGNYLKGGKRTSIAEAKAERSAQAKGEAQQTPAQPEQSARGEAPASKPATERTPPAEGERVPVPAESSLSGE